MSGVWVYLVVTDYGRSGGLWVNASFADRTRAIEYRDGLRQNRQRQVNSDEGVDVYAIPHEWTWDDCDFGDLLVDDTPTS